MRRDGLSSLAAALLLGEQSHRRAVLFAIAALLLLSTSPVFGHHLALGTHDFLAGVDHLGDVCLRALQLLLAPVHGTFHVILVVGLGYAVWDRLRAWRQVRRSLALLQAVVPTPGEPFWRAAEAAGVSPTRLRVVDGLPTPALTVGLLRPMVYVARDIHDELSDEELVAVLAHEGAHVARRDPLRLSCLRLIACLLFWIPALRRLADDMADEAEILADDRAAQSDPLVLASALLALASRTAVPATPPAVVGFHCRDLLERRVRRLAGEAIPAQSHVTRRSLLAAFVALSLAWSSGLVMAYPLSATAHPQHGPHCEHQDESPVGHLFCLRGHALHLRGACPHALDAPPLHAHV